MHRALVLLCVLGVAACTPAGAPQGTARSPSSGSSRELGAPTGLRYLGGQVEDGFARATQPRELVFPRDHGSHEEFRNEWWYFTGNLDTSAGRQFGFELTFFRVALAPPAAEPRASAWRTTQVWMAHFAITDVASGRIVASERLARGALGLAGATSAPFRIWVQDWSASGEADGRSAALALRAGDGQTSIDLELEALKPVVAHGDRGLDAKGPEPGNASYYYSFPRLSARGWIALNGVRSEVAGAAWMDREWSTSALPRGVVGWEWFGLQLADGRDVMLYRLRQADGTASAYSGGSLIAADGSVARLRGSDFNLEPTQYWTSPRTTVRYPVAWRLAIPSTGLTLSVEPRIPDQELDLSVRYWEGAVRASGRGAEGPVSGQGYLELAGF